MLLGIVIQLGNVHGVLRKSLHGQVTGGVMVGDWAGSAASQGYAVGSTPVTGSIVCWTDGGYGHVGYVTEVGQDGQIQILESNYNNQQQINNYRGWFDPQNSTTPGSVSYIYPGA